MIILEHYPIIYKIFMLLFFKKPILLAAATIGIMGIVVAFTFYGATAGNNDIEQIAPPITFDEWMELWRADAVEEWVVSINDVNDVSIIRTAGVVIQTQEPDYVLIGGDKKRIDIVRGLGFSLRNPVPEDYKRRVVKVWIHEKERGQRAYRILLSSSPFRTDNVPNFMYGAGNDSEIEWLRQEGYDVFLINE